MRSFRYARFTIRTQAPEHSSSREGSQAVRAAHAIRTQTGRAVRPRHRIVDGGIGPDNSNPIRRRARTRYYLGVARVRKSEYSVVKLWMALAAGPPVRMKLAG
jgi:hypothetical protein